MKKILLFISIVFLALFSNKMIAQTIDNILITDTLKCPGDLGNIQVTILNPNNTAHYYVVLQKMDASLAFNSHKVGQWEVTNTQSLSHSFSNLGPGNYRVLLVDTACSAPYEDLFIIPVTDTCIYDWQFQPLEDPDPISISVSDDTLDCWNSEDAIISVLLEGYTSPYQLWLYDAAGALLESTVLSFGDTSYSFTPLLTAGDYTVEGTGVFNCPIETESWTVTAPDTIIPGIITIDSISCFDEDDGELTINPIGGTQPPALTIDWYNVATGLIVATGNSTGTILPPGQYYALITDTMGCDTISDTITLLNPLELKASVISFTNPICFGDNNGSITIKIDSILQGSGGTFQFTQTGGAPWFDFPIPTPTEVTFSALPEGVYSNIRVRDVDSCEYSLPDVTLIEPPLLEFSISGDSTYNGFGVSCFGFCDAQITIDSVWGGNLPPYGNSSSYFGGVIFVDTLIGSDTCGSITGINYPYVVTDSLGCEGNDSITIFEPPVFSILANPWMPMRRNR